MTTYTINFTNNSSTSGNICIFQQRPNSPNPGSFPLAWIVRPAAPRSMVPISWNYEYYFFWARPGVLKPGAIFNAGEALLTSMTENNEVTLTKQDGNYKFVDQKTGSRPGVLRATSDNTTAVNQAGIGIGMSGTAAFAVQAQPNMTFEFVPLPKYWIMFGNFQLGQVLDAADMNPAVEVVFPYGIFSMNVTLNADNSWTITQGDF